MNTSTAAGMADLRPLAQELAGVGRLAPSLHNAQPWAFRVGPQHVDLLIDRTRLLPVADATTRQAHLGLGITAFLLRLSLTLATRHSLRATTVPYPWTEADRALADLAAGRYSGAAVLHLQD